VTGLRDRHGFLEAGPGQSERASLEVDLAEVTEGIGDEPRFDALIEPPGPLEIADRLVEPTQSPECLAAV
jgi:hypothetical protein